MIARGAPDTEILGPAGPDFNRTPRRCPAGPDLQNDSYWSYKTSFCASRCITGDSYKLETQLKRLLKGQSTQNIMWAHVYLNVMLSKVSKIRRTETLLFWSKLLFCSWNDDVNDLTVSENVKRSTNSKYSVSFEQIEILLKKSAKTPIAMIHTDLKSRLVIGRIQMWDRWRHLTKKSQFSHEAFQDSGFSASCSASYLEKYEQI